MKISVKFDETEEKIATNFSSTDENFIAKFDDAIEVTNPYSVLYVPQDLTEEQQLQAKQNIGIENYILPIASSDTLGGIKVGEGLQIDSNGTLSSTYQSDKTFVYEQMSASAVWDITHNLNKYPSVDVVDSAGSVVVGEVDYLSINEIKIKFIGAFSGKAFLN